MSARPLQGWEDNRLLLLKGPGYYDKPEGKDPIGKVWGLNKYAIALAVGWTAVDSFYITQAITPLHVAQNFGYYLFPLTGLATTFSCVTYISTNLRGKDDRLNYVMGAMACLPVLHAWKKTTSFTLYGTAMLIAAAYLKKDSKINGWQFYYSPEHQHPHFQYPDMSLVKDNYWPKRPI